MRSERKMTNTSKSKKNPTTSTKMSPSTPSPARASQHHTVSDLRKDVLIWYKILVLLYDLKTIKTDRNSQERIDTATHELYLSAPYFPSPDEAAYVQSALVNGVSAEKAISQRLENFFEKRRASGDARPCGPHDMVPVYLECFEIEKVEIEDEGFLRRVRKHGLRS